MNNHTIVNKMNENVTVYVLIINWNGWQDTIECLESVFRNDYPDYRVIVCDNDSGDGSLERIKAWAKGAQVAEVLYNNPLHQLSQPPVAKPIKYVEYSRVHAEAGGRLTDCTARLVLIQTGANLGFAGGNNVGLRYALARDDFDFVWMLNNDTVIEPDALTRLVQRLKDRPDAGMCGSTLPFYSEPGKIWALGGGTYNKWIAKSRSIGCGESVTNNLSATWVEARMDYLAGASMLVSRPFLRDVGLMNEEYFLYFEEPDWAVRGRGRFALSFAPDSIVYHKVGASIGNLDKGSARYWFAARLAIRNRLLFTRRFFPIALPTVALVCLGSLLEAVGTVLINWLRNKTKNKIKV